MIGAATSTAWPFNMVRLEDPLPYGIQRRIDQQGMPAQYLEFVNPPVGAEHAEQFHRA